MHVANSENFILFDFDCVKLSKALGKIHIYSPYCSQAFSLIVEGGERMASEQSICILIPIGRQHTAVTQSNRRDITHIKCEAANSCKTK